MFTDAHKCRVVLSLQCTTLHFLISTNWGRDGRNFKSKKVITIKDIASFNIAVLFVCKFIMF